MRNSVQPQCSERECCAQARYWLGPCALSNKQSKGSGLRERCKQTGRTKSMIRSLFCTALHMHRCRKFIILWREQFTEQRDEPRVVENEKRAHAQLSLRGHQRRLGRRRCLDCPQSQCTIAAILEQVCVVLYIPTFATTRRSSVNAQCCCTAVAAACPNTARAIRQQPGPHPVPVNDPVTNIALTDATLRLRWRQRTGQVVGVVGL
jgi:hypothetical protein